MTRRVCDALTQFEEGIDAAYAHLKTQLTAQTFAGDRDKAMVALRECAGTRIS